MKARKEGQFKIWRFEKARYQNTKYKLLLEDLLKLIPDKFEEYSSASMEASAGGKKEVNPDKDSEKIRYFGELKSMADFEKNCLSRKACAIGLIP